MCGKRNQFINAVKPMCEIGIKGEVRSHPCAYCGRMCCKTKGPCPRKGDAAGVTTRASSKQTKRFLQLRCASKCWGERCRVWKSRPWSRAVEPLLETCKILSGHLWKSFYSFRSSRLPLHLGLLFILLRVKQSQCALCWARHKTKPFPDPRILPIWNNVCTSKAWFWSQARGADMAYAFTLMYFTWDNGEGDHMFMNYL